MGNIMKYFIITVHILLGLVLIFMINSPKDIYSKVQNPQSFWPDYSVLHIVTETVIGIILGSLSIVGALAFRKDKRWAMFALPATTLILILELLLPLIITSAKGDRAAYAWTGGIMILMALILLAFLVSEVLYITLRKKTPSN